MWNRTLALLLAAVVATLGMAAPAGATTSPGGPQERSSRPVEYSLLQLNLCLSGLAGCFDDARYPAVVEEAVGVIRAEQPQAVTVNEGCSGDVARIAAETGMQHRFATVLYRGAPLPCVEPGGRGVFGNAVLTRAAITSAQEQAFQAQLGAEERRWLCVATTDGVRVCTSHLSVAGSEAEAATNEAQCRELAVVLTTGERRGTTVFAGDVNRQSSCAPTGSWTVRDDQATQARGIQHAYGSRRSLLGPVVQTVPMTFTDHDALLVRALLRPAPTG